MKNDSLYREAQALRGCLARLRTKIGRRRYDASKDRQDVFILSDPFAGDIARITSSKAYRNLAHKTQVLTDPHNTFIRSRMTHTTEVVACAIVISEMLGLNTSLAQAIAFGHDIGHVPFGHQGESFLAEIMRQPNFCHENMGVIIAQDIERKGAGLNLTFETLEGIQCHSGCKARAGMTAEAWAVRYADKLAYIFHDFNDFQRVGHPIPRELQMLMDGFGSNQRERTNTAIAGLILESSEAGKVSFDHCDWAQKFAEIRVQMYKVYPMINVHNPVQLIRPVIEFLIKLDESDPFLTFALMTDKDVAYIASQQNKQMEHLRQTAIFEQLPFLRKLGSVDLCDPDMDW